MTKQNLKAVYAEGNPHWRSKLPDGADRRLEQPWIDHHANMTYDDAIAALASARLRREQRHEHL